MSIHSTENKVNYLKQDLKRCIVNKKENTDKLQILLELAQLVERKDCELAHSYANQALELAVLLENDADNAKAREILGKSFWRLSEYEESIMQYQAAINKYKMLSDYYGLAKCYSGMGIVSASIDDYNAAIQYFEYAISAAQRAEKHILSATISGNIGHTHFQFGNYQSAMDCFEHAYWFYIEIEALDGVANMLEGMAGVKVVQANYNEAIENLRTSLVLRKQINDKQGIAVTSLNLGITLRQQGEINKAKIELENAFCYMQSIGLKAYQQETLKQLMDVCLELNQTTTFNSYLQLYESGQYEVKKSKEGKKKISSRI